MQLRCSPLRLLAFVATGWACVAPTLVRGQNPPGQDVEVIRINAALVQTDVMVFDKQGGFVDGLKRDQFALKIDGKPRPIAFFDRVTAGSRNEEAQLAAARGHVMTGGAADNAGPVPLDRGRTVFFFIDDLHLSVSSMNQAHGLLLRFIDREMGQNDEAEIMSTSGQIGFLQQLTDSKAVLRAAVERLRARPYMVRDMDNPPMSEYQALQIDGNDSDVLDFFIDEVLKQNPLLPRGMAGDMVRTRASQMLRESASVTTNTLASLQTLVKTSARLPGRKLIFVVSDGFFLDLRNSDAHERLQQITAAAAASGVIIYSIDARGLATGAIDASSRGAFDPSGRLQRGSAGELPASQDGLYTLASDTGGRAFFHSNMLSAAVSTALKESSVYYLLAWRPENEDQRNPKFRRIEVSVTGRPDLVVRLRRAFEEAGPAEAAIQPKNKQPVAIRKTPAEDLRAALLSPYPKRTLPVTISLNFIDLPGRGSILTTSLEVSTSSLVLEAQAGPPTAKIDLAGVIFDDQGKSVSSFEKHLTIKSNTTGATAPPPDSVFYNNYSAIKPGLYQVRVAAVEEKQGRAGSAMEWIEIPDLESKILTLSSLIVGENRAESESRQSPSDQVKQGESPVGQVRINIGRHFARSSRLRFLTFVYNARPGPAGAATTAAPTKTPAADQAESNAAPDLAVQVQVFRDNEPVITTPLHKIQTQGAPDLARLPYAAEVAIEDLQPGRYRLQVTVIDRIAKASASQQFSFQVD